MVFNNRAARQADGILHLGCDTLECSLDCGYILVVFVAALHVVALVDALAGGENTSEFLVELRRHGVDHNSFTNLLGNRSNGAFNRVFHRDLPSVELCIIYRVAYAKGVRYYAGMAKSSERKARAKRLVSHLKKTYPKPKTELRYKTPFQLVVAVMLSAQTTDKAVNKVTDVIYKKYKTPKDFAHANLKQLTKEISSLSFFRNKAKAVIGAAKKIEVDFKGKVPRTVEELVTLPGVAYKTANVVLGELYDIWEGIPTDTHVKRFAHRFDLVDSKDLTKISKELEALIPKKDWKYVNNGLVLYGRYICKAREHDCANHPLTKIWPKALNRWPKAN